MIKKGLKRYIRFWTILTVLSLTQNHLPKKVYKNYYWFDNIIDTQLKIGFMRFCFVLKENRIIEKYRLYRKIYQVLNTNNNFFLFEYNFKSKIPLLNTNTLKKTIQVTT